MRLFTPKPHPSFTASIHQLEAFKQLITETACPACGQETLQLHKYERGDKGWDAEVACTNCNFVGVVNSTGFRFTSVSSKGKARE